MANSVSVPSRRTFLKSSSMLRVASIFPTIVPAHVLGTQRGGSSKSRGSRLGLSGIGPRCTYDLKAMLGLADVKSLAIADVQATRRDAGKKLPWMTTTAIAIASSFETFECCLIAKRSTLSLLPPATAGMRQHRSWRPKRVKMSIAKSPAV